MSYQDSWLYFGKYFYELGGDSIETLRNPLTIDYGDLGATPPQIYYSLPHILVHQDFKLTIEEVVAELDKIDFPV